jgi:hypothetical protein
MHASGDEGVWSMDEGHNTLGSHLAMSVDVNTTLNTKYMLFDSHIV